MTQWCIKMLPQVVLVTVDLLQVKQFYSVGAALDVDHVQHKSILIKVFVKFLLQVILSLTSNTICGVRPDREEMFRT